MGDLGALAGLFLTALLAATVLPAQSELLLAGLHLAGRHDRFVLVAVATAGNVLGSVINWVLGRYLGPGHESARIVRQAEKVRKSEV